MPEPAPPDPPPGVTPEGLPARPEAPVPASEAVPLAPDEAFGEPLPPNFWDDAEPPEAFDDDAEDGYAAPATTSSPPAARREVVGRLEDDPRFAVMQSLFPGRVTAWQEAEQKGLDEAAGEAAGDESEAVETVDLEAET